LKIPADALDEVTIAQPTIAKATKTRRIRNLSKKTKRGTPLPAFKTPWLPIPDVKIL
jgi:hypothetical protein